MRRVEYRISPEAFSKLKETMMDAEVRGYGPTECAAMALVSVGLGPSNWPPKPVETVLVVDYARRATCLSVYGCALTCR